MVLAKRAVTSGGTSALFGSGNLIRKCLMDQLLALVEIDLRVVALETVARAADREALLVEEAADLANDQHVLALVITAIAAPLHGLELRKLLFPITQYVRFDAAQVADFADREVALAGNRRQLAIVAWFQHRPLPEPSVFGQDGR